MKKTLIPLVAIFLLSGCGWGESLNRSVNSFRQANPGIVIIPVDENGDGTPEYYAPDSDGDGRADKDPSGRPVEVPGTRAALGGAGAADDSIAELLGLAAAIVGVPGVGLVGAWWGKRKPIKQFTKLVESFEAAKQDETPDGYITLSKDVLRAIQAERPELESLIDAIRKSAKA